MASTPLIQTSDKMQNLLADLFQQYEKTRQNPSAWVEPTFENGLRSGKLQCIKVTVCTSCNSIYHQDGNSDCKNPVADYREYSPVNAYTNGHSTEAEISAATSMLVQQNQQEELTVEDVFGGSDETTIQSYFVSAPVVPQPDANGEFLTPADGAKFMASFGIPQIPLRPKTKIAQETDWPNKKTTDFAQIDKLAQLYPGCNFASVSKANFDGFFSVEVDSLDVRDRIKAATGEGFTSKSGVISHRGGHRWYQHSIESLELGNIKQGEVEHSDFSVRGDNQYCCSPGSVHPISGKQYRLHLPFLKPDVISCRELDWIKAQQKVDQFGKKETPKNSAGLVPHGAIHDYLIKLAGTLRNSGMNPEEIEMVLLRKAHEDCVPPLDDDKIRAAARYAEKWEEGNPVSKMVFSGNHVVGATPHAEMIQIVADEILEFTDSSPEAEIPAFDPTVMTGIYKEWVDLVCHGTTLAPQFAFLAAKTIIGALMSGKVTFKDLDAEPRIYVAFVGKTGSGKGAAWERSLQILNSVTSGLKIVNSIDSGAGLTDYFFEPPVGQPVICYIDEVTSLGNKAASTRNPAILDAIIELADSTSRSRVLAKRGKNPERIQKTRDDCRLAMVMCGQDRDVFAKALTGRNQLGVYDRLTPEYGVPVEPGKMPPIEKAAAMLLMTKILSLNYQAVMEMSQAADDRLEAFWGTQEKETRVKVRWKRNLQMDAYMVAFGEKRSVVESSDVEIATKTFTRQLAIRKACFGAEMVDRTAYYLDKIKQVTAWMRKKIAEGAEPGQVARSRRDYERNTNAARDNEEHLFDKAWQIHSRVHLDPVKVRKTNGQEYDKFVPKPDW
jgi:hypothetical protein